MAAGDDPQHDGADDAADHLRDDVADQVGCRQPSGEECAERDGRVEMRARHRADRIGHRHHGDAEGQRDADAAARQQAAKAAGDDARAADEDQPERPEDFRNI